MAYFQTTDTGVIVNLRDQNGYALHCQGTVAASTLDTASEYQKGCIYLKTDVVTGSKAAYENVGTVAVPSWNLLGDITAGEITLAEGSLLVGNASGVAAALDASTDTQILVGNGTTATSVAVSGDATLANDGALTVTGSTGAFGAGGTVTVGAGAGIASNVANGKVPFYKALVKDNITAGTGGAIAITNYYTTVNTDADDDAFTLADGDIVGQVKRIQLIADGGGDAVITPANFVDGTTITMADAGDYSVLIWNGTGWTTLEDGNTVDGVSAPVIA
jgi:hypothetical protein